MSSVHYLQARTDRHLEQILELQRCNSEAALPPNEASAQGFVTVRHDLKLLREMNRPDPHIIAVHEQNVVGYALVMQREFKVRLPILEPLFERLESLTHNGRPVEDCRYFIMGQVCVARPFRGQGVFGGLYQEMRHRYAGSYDLVITEVADRNQRSIRAHEKAGFRLLHHYSDPDGEAWHLVYWDWH